MFRLPLNVFETVFKNINRNKKDDGKIFKKNEPKLDCFYNFCYLPPTRYAKYKLMFVASSNMKVTPKTLLRLNLERFLSGLCSRSRLKYTNYFSCYLSKLVKIPTFNVQESQTKNIFRIFFM